jgi:hypothetical protein
MRKDGTMSSKFKEIRDTLDRAITHSDSPARGKLAKQVKLLLKEAGWTLDDILADPFEPVEPSEPSVLKEPEEGSHEYIVLQVLRSCKRTEDLPVQLSQFPFLSSERADSKGLSTGQVKCGMQWLIKEGYDITSDPTSDGLDYMIDYRRKEV